MTLYYRPLAQVGPVRPDDALALAGGWAWFTHAEVLARGAPPRVVPAAALPADWRARLTAPRPPLVGVAWDAPRLMGILNVTPDSFSDGGEAASLPQARARAAAMAAEVDLLDIGGESTRPGATDTPTDVEAARVIPVVAALAGMAGMPPLSIDTRKARVARAALQAGAAMVNDVSALGFDASMAATVADAGVPLCLMHARGTPAAMQDGPRYDDVLLDVYDALAGRVAAAEAAGIDRARLIVDPGIGFGKTAAHNLALLAGVALFHGLGCPVLVGASRKRFIGTLAGEAPGTAAGAQRAPGSLAVMLACAAQGVQIARMHDTAAAAQALRLWRASITGSQETTP